MTETSHYKLKIKLINKLKTLKKLKQIPVKKLIDEKKIHKFHQIVFVTVI